MLRRAPPLASPPSTVRPVPAWVRPKAQSFEVVDAAFLAGASLAALDPIARETRPWAASGASAWRCRRRPPACA